MGQGFRGFLSDSKPLIKGVNERVRLHSLSHHLIIYCFSVTVETKILFYITRSVEKNICLSRLT